ncbi:MAG: hypothetical protein ACRDJ3_11185 [Solirubrobacteraceae bacterium]
MSNASPLLALGARIPHALYPRPHDRPSQPDDILHGLLQDLEDGYVKRLAFVVPARRAWQLPIYEIALMTAKRAYENDVVVSITIVTPEDCPLAIFGLGASGAVSRLLDKAGITVLSSSYAEVPQWDTVMIDPGDRRLAVDRVVALPLEGLDS